MIQPGILKSDVLIGLGVDGPIIGGGGGGLIKRYFKVY